MEKQRLKQIADSVIHGERSLNSWAKEEHKNRQTLDKEIRQVLEAEKLTRYKNALSNNRTRGNTRYIGAKEQMDILRVIRKLNGKEITIQEALKELRMTDRRTLDRAVETLRKGETSTYLVYCNRIKQQTSNKNKYDDINFKELISYMLINKKTRSKVAMEYNVSEKKIAQEIGELGEDSELFRLTEILKRINNRTATTEEIKEYDEKIENLTVGEIRQESKSEKELEDFMKQIYVWQKQGKSKVEMMEMLQMDKTVFYRKIQKALVDTQIRKEEEQVGKDAFIMLPEEIKQEVVYTKVNKACEGKRKKPYTRSQFNSKFEENKRYYTEQRNMGLKYPNDREAYITPEDYLFMIYISPNSFTYSLEDNVKYKMNNLDKQVGITSANKMIKTDPSIIGSSIDNLNSKIAILQMEGMLEEFIEKPKNLRASPAVLYACIQLSKTCCTKEKKDAARIMDMPRMKGISREQLLSYYPLPEKYKVGKEMKPNKVHKDGK